MIYQKYIARCCRVYQHERNENASFLSIFNGGGRPKWRFSNFRRFWKNSSALGSFNCIFENKSLKALFGENMKKLKILKLSPDSRYLQTLALKWDKGIIGEVRNCWGWDGSVSYLLSRPVTLRRYLLLQWDNHYSKKGLLHGLRIFCDTVN